MAKRRLPNPVAEYFEGIRKPKAVKSLPRPLLDAKALVNVLLDDNAPLEPRAMCALQLFTLGRPSELCALKWSDIDLPNQEIYFTKKVELTESGFAVKAGSKTGVKAPGKCFACLS